MGGAGGARDPTGVLVRRKPVLDDQSDEDDAGARKPPRSLPPSLSYAANPTLARRRRWLRGLYAAAAILLVLTGAAFCRRDLHHNFTARLFAASKAVPSPPDVLITIYSYDRPSDLLRLLRDLDAALSENSLSSAVHILDDNSLSCVPPRAATENFFDPDSSTGSQVGTGHDHSLPVTQLAGTRTRSPDASSEDLTVTCSARTRFRLVESYVREREHLSWRLFVAHYRHGRRRLWHLVRMAHRLAWRVSGARDGLSDGTRYFLFLPDDVRLCRDFVGRATAAWDAVEDERKLSLMLHIEESRVDAAVWTDLLPQRLSPELVRIGWVESGNFICGRGLLRFTNWSFPRVPVQRWVDNPPISSGVGATLSGLIHAGDYRMYRTSESLVAHVGVRVSKMNGQFREKGVAAHETLFFADGDAAYRRFLREGATVSASIASKWTREVTLHVAVDSLAPQVDHIFLYLNDYEAVPSFARVSYVTAVLSAQSDRGDMGDVGKFFWANDLRTEFHATADDDILYPPDYISRMLAEHARYSSPVAVGGHGINIKPAANSALTAAGRRNSLLRRKGYYANREVFMGTGVVEKAESVHILGTGTTVYRVSDFGAFDVDEDFPEGNMADVWFAKRAQLLKIALVTLPHGEGWLKDLPGTFSDSIYSVHSRKKGDAMQTRAVIDMVPWVHHSFVLVEEERCGELSDACK